MCGKIDKLYVKNCNKKVRKLITNLANEIIMLYIKIIKLITKIIKEITMIKNQKTNSKAIEGRIIENFRNSGLTQDQYLNSCKQILFVKRNNKNFAKLILEEKEEYLTKNNILGYRFLGDKHLIEIFDEIEQISLTDIYLNITNIYSIKFVTT